ncbi:MAG: zinc ABC transporter substrate-binding protein [Oscillospiraceae bacterium]|nr:zinc ABC transporter substrate-binding protein [Oscillospiraceae bacterium]
MKRTFIIILIVMMLVGVTACSAPAPNAQIAATTLPVYDFTSRLCAGTNLQITRVISQEISCLHDYTLQVNQMKAIENAQLLVISGAGLEDGLLPNEIRSTIIDSSQGIKLSCGDNEHEHKHEHHHTNDPHIWLSPKNAKIMAANICRGLSGVYPEYAGIFSDNLTKLTHALEKLEQHAESELADLKCRKLVTFHDGFSYMAQAWGLELLHAVEEESGSEASAKELISLTELVTANQLPAIFTEKSGSASAAQIITAETGIPSYCLDMAMSGDSYFDAMYHNIRTLKEALG